MGFLRHLKGLRRALASCAAAFAWGAFGAVEIADTVDLAAEDLSSTGLVRVHDDKLDEDVVLCDGYLSGSGTIMNSGEETVTLLIKESGPARCNFSGRITGNVRVVLRNALWQAFVSDCSDYTGGTWLDGGWLYVSSYDALGTGDVTLSGGARLTYTGSTGVDAGYSGTYNTTFTNRIVVSGSGRLGAYADKSVTIAGEVVMTNATLMLDNYGKMTFASPFKAENVVGGTLRLNDARMLAAPSVFGTSPGAVLPLTVDFRNNGGSASSLTLTEPGTLCLSNVVFNYLSGNRHGGGICGGVMPYAPSAGAIEDWRTGAVVRVFGELSVKSGHATNDVAAVSIENGSGAGRVSVADGATLAFTGALSVPAGRGLQKTGAGTLALLGGLDVDGACRVEAGTLELGRNVKFPETTALSCGHGARVVLNDGAAITSPPLARDGGFAATADVWLDMTAIAGYADGDAVSVVPNLGTAGGTFEPAEHAERPGLPTYARSGINGLPALNFNGGTSWPLGLCTKAYTNKTTTITVFHVLLFDSWELSKNKWCMPLASGPFVADGKQVDLWDTSLGFHYRFNNASYPTRFQIRANGINDEWDLTGVWGGVGHPVLFASRRDGSSGFHVAYSDDMGTRTRSVSFYGAAALGIDFLSLGAASYQSGKAMDMRAFPGKIGEVIVFTRALSDEEIESVNAYLKAKWFGVSDDGAKMYEAPAGQNVEVSVPAAATAFLVPGFSVTDESVTGDWTKTGEGTLRLGGSAAHAASVAAAEGAIEIAPATAAASAAIWFDAADAATVALNSDGTVASVANKGSAGGLFVKAPGTTSVATYVSDGINGRACAQFDWHSGLSLDAWTNTASRNVHVYGVFMRTDTQDDGSSFNKQGRFAGPFSFYHTSLTGEDSAVRGNYHVEERISQGVDTIAHWFGSDSYGMDALGAELHTGGNVWVVPNPWTTGEAYMYVSHQLPHGMAFAYETADDDPAELTLYATNSPSVSLSPFFVNRTVLGGRMRDGGMANETADYSRMWHGRVGEFIVLDHLPSQAEDAAILAYLRKKWFGKGTATGEPPTCLAGAGALRDSSSLALAMGADTALVQAGPTAALGSLALADGVSVRREAASAAPDAFKLFDVAGVLSLAGNLSFSCDPAPAQDAPAFAFGSCDDSATWTLDVPGRARAHFAPTADAYWLRLTDGFLLILR